MHIGLDQIRFLGKGLNRPECVVAHRSGLLLVPDWTGSGGISILTLSGVVHRVLVSSPAPGVDLPVRPNGIALEPGGSVLLAHLGEVKGGVYRLWPDGRCEVVVDTVNGRPMPPSNFVTRARDGRLWIAVSTMRQPRSLDYRPMAATGYLALYRDGEARIAAEGLGYTNECVLSEDEGALWVNETFGRRLTAFDVAGGLLVNRRTVAEFGSGVFPDGLAPAADGSLLVTSIVSNRILRVGPDGTVIQLLEDADIEHLTWVETAFQANEMGRPHLDTMSSKILRNVSNLAFGGSDLGTAYLGCLLGDSIACFASPVPGRPLPHWDYDLGDLAHYAEAPA